MRIFLTGGTGFVGSHILRALIQRGHQVRALTRKAASDTSERDVEWASGDVLEPDTLSGLLQDCDAVIHLVGILEERRSKGLTFEAVHAEGTRHVVDAARASGIDRFIQMSANGARKNGVSRYQSTKWEAEEYVRAAGFAHAVIFRPTVIFGDPGPEHPEFSKLLAQTLVKPFPVLPVPGNGKYEMQPIAIESVAAAFVQALDLPSTADHTYDVGGRERISFNEVLDRIAIGLGSNPKPKVHHPLWMVRPAVRAGSLTGKLPITIDQLEMLVEGNTCDSTPFFARFDVPELPYEPENLTYLRKYV